MAKVMGVTKARARLREVVDDVVEHGEEVILARDSEPAAVLIPYALYRDQQASARELWRTRFQAALRETRKHVRQWARKKGIKRLTDRKVEELILGA